MSKTTKNRQFQVANQQPPENHEELKRNLERASLGKHIADLGYFERNWQTGKGNWSKGFYNLLGVTPKDIDCTHEDILKYVHKDDLKRVTEHIQTTLQEKTAMNIEFRIVQADGNVVDIHGIAENFYDETGKPLKTIGTFQNIAERKKLLSKKQTSIEELSFLNRIFISAQKTKSLDKISELVAKEISNLYDDALLLFRCMIRIWGALGFEL